MNGTLDKPIINGKIIIQNGILYLDPINEPIDHIIGNLSINNNQLIIEKLTGNVTANKSLSLISNIKKYIYSKKDSSWNNVNIYGSIDLTEFFNPDFALKLKGESLAISSSYDLFNGTGDVNINITGQDTMLISGELIPAPYDFTITSLGDDTPYEINKDYTKRTIVYDLHVPIKDAIKIDTENLNLIVEGDLNIANTSEEKFNFSGKAEIIDGNFYDNQGNIFQHTNGTILLSPVDNLPYIDIHAQTKIEDNSIDVSFIGYTDNPQLIFHSPDYRYTQTEILQILTFGNTDGINENESKQAGNLLSNFVENEIEKNISRYSPLDEFQLTSKGSLIKRFEGTDDIDLKLMLGKQITNKIYLNTQFNFDDEGSLLENAQYEATYRLSRRSSIVGGVDADNKRYLSYRIKYYY